MKEIDCSGGKIPFSIENGNKLNLPYTKNGQN